MAILKEKYPSMAFGVLLAFFIFISPLSGQNNSEVTKAIDSRLVVVDKLLKNEEFIKVKSSIDSLKNTVNYKKNSFDKLAVDLREAQYFYGIHENEKAIHQMLDGIAELEKHKDSKLYWDYVFKLANLYKKDGNYAKAHYYLDLALINANIRTDEVSLIRNNDIKARTYYAESSIKHVLDSSFRQLTDSAIFYAKKNINSKLNESNEKYLAEAYTTYGSILLDDSTKYNLSEKYLEKALLIKKRLKDTLAIAIATTNYGNIFYVKNKYYEAIIEYASAYKLSKNIKTKGSIRAQMLTLQNISWAFSELKDFEKAYKYQEKTRILVDSLEILNKTRDIAAIEARYLEAQKTQKEKTKRLQSQVLFYGVSLLTLALSIIGYFVYKHLKNKQRRAEDKIAGLKYKALNAQMNPHFINNLLIAIQELIDTDNKQEAMVHLSKFNTLTNLVLRATKSNLIRLKDEINMLQLYLDLQQLRFDHSFNYSLNIDTLKEDDINQLKIPPLILQPLVENSITHGISKNGEKGHIKVDFKMENSGYLVCSIHDNGNGDNSKLNKNSAGISLKNIRERLGLIDKKNGNKDLVSFEKFRGKDESIIGSKTVLNIPLIY